MIAGATNTTGFGVWALWLPVRDITYVTMDSDDPSFLYIDHRFYNDALGVVWRLHIYYRLSMH